MKGGGKYYRNLNDETAQTQFITTRSYGNKNNLSYFYFNTGKEKKEDLQSTMSETEN